MRESNPRLVRERHQCYHYTNEYKLASSLGVCFERRMGVFLMGILPSKLVKITKKKKHLLLVSNNEESFSDDFPIFFFFPIGGSNHPPFHFGDGVWG